MVLHVFRHFVLNGGIVDGNGCGHDEQIFVVSAPERMNGGHQAQDAAGPLKLVERGPVVVKPVE